MTATKRKSAPTAGTVEGTNPISQENDTTLPYIFQDPDEKTHTRVRGKSCGYDLIRICLIKLYKEAYSHKPDRKSTRFIKAISKFVAKAYSLGISGHPCFNLDHISPDKVNPHYRDGYVFLHELISSAYRQGLSKEPYDLYKGNWQDIQSAQ